MTIFTHKSGWLTFEGKLNLLDRFWQLFLSGIWNAKLILCNFACGKVANFSVNFNFRKNVLITMTCFFIFLQTSSPSCTFAWCSVKKQKKRSTCSKISPPRRARSGRTWRWESCTCNMGWSAWPLRFSRKELNRSYVWYVYLSIIIYLFVQRVQHRA